MASSDLFYDELDGPEPRWLAAGAAAVEMEAATLFTLARRRGFEAAAVLIVSGRIGSRQRIEPDALVVAEQRAGALAAGALA